MELSFESAEKKDIAATPLPKLKPNLNLSKFENAADGSPRWTLHDPVLNEYYRLEWPEFEVISRLHLAGTVGELVGQVNVQTPLEISAEDVAHVLAFLAENNLLAMSSASAQRKEAQQQGWLHKLLHGYLFFTIPLIKPQGLLDRAYPYIKPFFSRSFMIVMVVLMGAGMIMTAGRIDEFTHTFMQLLTPGGIALSAVILIVIKIIHEFAHAFAATKHGIPVPHMGVAFIIMYPVLYTETTASWQVSSRRGRMEIGLAGVTAELYLAAIFLLLWNIVPDPALQAICVSVIAISLIGSLLVNLNPLMRFDGYYICSDMMGIENLQNRAFEAARWKIRRWLFATPEAHPDEFSPLSTQKFLTIFGLCVLIYRFFLFLGIAFLVYYLFFKPLGLFLMLFELWWFIARPVWHEMKRWGENKDVLFSNRRTKVTGGILAIVTLLLFLPINTYVRAPAMLVPVQMQSIYPPESAYIQELNIQNSQAVKGGDVLAVLTSDALDKEYQKAQIELDRMRVLRSKQNYLPDHLKPTQDINTDIIAAENAVQQIEIKMEKLRITAPFDGVITDLDPLVTAGRSVYKGELLFRIKNTKALHVIGFVNEKERDRIGINNKAVFHADMFPHTGIKAYVSNIAVTNSEYLQWPELSSLYGGQIASVNSDGQMGEKPYIKPLYSTYMITLDLEKMPDQDIEMIVRGNVRISSSLQVPAWDFMQQIAALFKREINLN
jgi:putative peptide zinc metalloprotease protein